MQEHQCSEIEAVIIIASQMMNKKRVVDSDD
jgi:hypothetical protein